MSEEKQHENFWNYGTFVEIMWVDKGALYKKCMKTFTNATAKCFQKKSFKSTANNCLLLYCMCYHYMLALVGLQVGIATVSLYIGRKKYFESVPGLSKPSKNSW